MERQAVLTDTKQALAQIRSGLDQLGGADLAQLSAAELAQVQASQEELRRRLAYEQNRCLDAVDSTKAHHRDGHSSAKVMIRHQAKLSNQEALGRQQTMEALRHLPLVAQAFKASTIGTEQVRLLARVWSNKRVRNALAMAGRQRTFIKLARRVSFPEFRAEVLQWQRLIDEDGPTPENEKNHANRNMSVQQDPFGLGWKVRGSLGAGHGAELAQIFARYQQAEFEADWEDAKQTHGDKTMMSHLARTEAQRRADAFMQMMRDAGSSPDGAVPPTFTHNIVWSNETFEEMVRRFAGAEPQPFDPDTFRCETIDGIKLDPTETFANAVLNRVRRAVINTKSVIIDLGTARLFTGNARAAVQLTTTRCIWPGCSVPTTQCQADHLTDHAKGGRTCPENGAPLCGRHNRWKQKGFTVRRDPAGEWLIFRPDRTRVR